MPDTTIRKISGRRVWDSRGRPTVEAEIELACGARGMAIAPAGASRGAREAVDLRDADGVGVKAAVANVNGAIAKTLAGMDAGKQEDIDRALIALDGTPNKASLGANATVAVSLAALHAAADAQGLPLFRYLAQGRPVRLPLPEIQIFGGGAHAGRRIDIQDLMVMALAAKSFDEALEMTARVYRAAGELMRDAGKLHGVADEGGWWPEFASNEEAIETLVRAIARAGFVPGDEVAISLDIAASEFGAGGLYRLGLEGRSLDSDGMGELVLGWLERYPIVSVEDPLAEDDRAGMMRFTAAAGQRVQIIGDDYLTTSAERVQAAIADRACNAVLLKPNQCGTVTETRAALDLAKSAGWGCIVSARSGETEDLSIVHLATGWDAGQLKVGSFARGERMAKWNEALRIEEMLGADARFAGYDALPIRR
ncbi:MAG: phosphopyruvate hydratase [Burkholderiales bacterium]